MQRWHNDAEFIVITGDLCDSASKSAYEELKSEISKIDLPIYLLVGNHDDRELFGKFFPSFINHGFVQYSIKIKNRAFLFLDTLVENHSYGSLCEKRIDWLKKRLKEYKDSEIYIFMHHHPVKSGLFEMDNEADFKTSEEFWELLESSGSVKHIAFGHLHRIFHGVKNGISFHSTRGTAFEVALVPSKEEEFLTNKEKPTYAVMELENEEIRVHHHEFLDEDEIYKGYC